MPESAQLSPRAAVVVGLIFVAAGVVAVLASVGLIPVPLTKRTPPWVGIAVGVLFLLGGAAVFVGYAVGRAGPDGDFAPGTPFGVRLIQYMLGLGIVGLLTAIFGWTAFGPGPREFSTTIDLPFVPARWASEESTGRAVFGAGAVLLFVFFVVLSLVGARRLRMRHER